MASSARRVSTLVPKLLSNLSRNVCKLPQANKIVNQQCLSRMFATSAVKSKEQVSLTFKFQDGSKKSVQADVGDSILDVVIDKNVDIDGFGACEGTLACSTCHLLLTQTQFDSLPELPTDEELDMLDLAYQLTDTSRLGCQITVTKDMDNWEIEVPEGVADAREV